MKNEKVRRIVTFLFMFAVFMMPQLLLKYFNLVYIIIVQMVLVTVFVFLSNKNKQS